MSAVLAFMGDHPVLTFFLALIAASIVELPFGLANRVVRSRNIKNAGWPPAHLDADGDWKREEDDE